MCLSWRFESSCFCFVLGTYQQEFGGNRDKRPQPHRSRAGAISKALQDDGSHPGGVTSHRRIYSYIKCRSFKQQHNSYSFLVRVLFLF